jgi:hypothetical protein
MGVFLIKQTIITVCLFSLLLLISSTLEAFEWQEYSARYSLYRNGKLAGKADMKLERNGDTWVMSTEGSGTHGLARLLRARDREYVEGQFDNGRFLPLRFEHKVSVAGIGNEWSAQFDWPKDTVLVELEKNSVELDLQGEALDGLSLKLEMQRRLRLGEDNMKFLLVDEDEIEEQVFRILPSVMLETSLGCLETIPVERVRREGSSRYTRAWYAPALEYLTVRLEHGKTDGDHMEMRIAELKQANKPYSPGTGCSAQQSG